MRTDSRIYVAGSTGMVGSAIIRNLRKRGYTNIIDDRVDLRNTEHVNHVFERGMFDYVFLAAAKVGGIMANSTYPGDFIYDNLMIQTNVIEACRLFGIKKLVFLGSSCIYPRDCPQPIKEESLMTGPLEATNDAYAVAKIAGIKMCQAYRNQHGLNAISLMPTNLYGPGDNFDPNTSHVLPAMIRKFHVAKEMGTDVELWGNGTPLREFMYVDDMADATVHCMLHYNSPDIINIGVGKDITVKGLAYLVAKAVGYEGEIKWDLNKPTGTPQKLLDISKLSMLEWHHSIDLREGIKNTYSWYKEKFKDEKLIRPLDPATQQAYIDQIWEDTNQASDTNVKRALWRNGLQGASNE